MPTTLSGLAIIVLFIVPGFVMAAAFNSYRNVIRYISDLFFIVSAIVFSLIVHAVFAFWSVRIYKFWQSGDLLKNVPEFYIWLVIVVLVFPFVAGLVLARIFEANSLQTGLARIGFSVLDRTVTCWDWFARSGRAEWLIVEFKDGTRIGGRLGTGSRISLTRPDVSKEPRDIFIEEIYDISPDGRFGARIPNTRGAWINCSDVKVLRAF